MNNMIPFLALGVAIITFLLAIVLTQKKSGELKKLTEELIAVQKEKDEISARLEDIELRFEEKVDDVVQSSIQKISHAEEAKEEAVKAAHDNYEAAAEAIALLREKEATIKELQGKVS
ncbi:MAG: hypothetical protein ACN4GW_16730 [Desulforhopalus sp.]